MSQQRVAVVSRDRDMRLRAARVFDRAPVEWNVALFEEAPDDADVVVVAPDVPDAGLRLDLERPQVTLDAIRARLERKSHGRLIAVASAGGGTGCTSVGLHLAAFMNGGEATLYVEGRADCGGRARAGLDLEGPSWADVVDAGSSARCALPIAAGVRGVFAPPEGTIPDETIERCRAWGDVILDLGHYVHDDALTKAHRVVMVLPPSIPAARRTRAILARYPDVPWVLVTNRLGPGSEATTRMLEAVIDRRVTLGLPCSPSLRDAEDEGRLLGEHASGWSRRVATLARALEGS